MNTKRTVEQNAAQWRILKAWSKQKEWLINGQKTFLHENDWKDILTATYEGEVAPRLAPGLYGGIVMLGRRTSEYEREKFSEWLDWLNHASVALGVDVDQG
jgi:hypothetical protein